MASKGSRYDGSGYYRLLNPDGRLAARGSYDWCLRRLQDECPGQATEMLGNGWVIEPVQMDAITGANKLK